MHEGGLAHDARRAADAAADADFRLVQLRVGALDLLRGRALVFHDLRLVLFETRDDGRDRVLVSRHVAALELVRIRVADQPVQLLKVLASRLCLVVLFDERDVHKNIVNRKLVNRKS